MEQPQQTYLKEIQWRTFYLILGFFFSLVIAQKERQMILSFLVLPLNELSKKSLDQSPEVFSENIFALEEEPLNFVFLQISEALTIQIQLSFLLGLFVSIPSFWLHIWFFFGPALYQKEQKTLLQIGVLSQILLVLSTQFTQKFLLPNAWAFFLSFGDLGNTSTLSNSMDPLFFLESTEKDLEVLAEKKALKDQSMHLSQLPSLGPQVSFFMEICFAIILTAQLPIVFFLMIHWGWLKESLLVNSRPWFILFLLLWAALISPPDIWSQFLIFLPLFAIQELVVFFSFFEKNQKKLKRQGSWFYLGLPRGHLISYHGIK